MIYSLISIYPPEKPGEHLYVQYKASPLPRKGTKHMTAMIIINILNYKSSVYFSLFS